MSNLQSWIVWNPFYTKIRRHHVERKHGVKKFSRQTSRNLKKKEKPLRDAAVTSNWTSSYIVTYAPRSWARDSALFYPPTIPIHLLHFNGIMVWNPFYTKIRRHHVQRKHGVKKFSRQTSRNLKKKEKPLRDAAVTTLLTHVETVLWGGKRYFEAVMLHHTGSYFKGL